MTCGFCLKWKNRTYPQNRDTWNTFNKDTRQENWFCQDTCHDIQHTMNVGHHLCEASKTRPLCTPTTVNCCYNK